MLKIFLFIIIFIFISCEGNLQSKYNKALQHSENKEYRESNIILDEIINSKNSSKKIKFESYFLLADIFLKIKQYEEAINSYKSILDAPFESKLRISLKNRLDKIYGWIN